MLLTKWTTGFACVAALAAWMAPAASAQSTPTSGKSAQPAGNAERIRRIEENAAVVPQGESKPLIRLSLQDLMEKFKVPGLSIAVIDNFQVIWAKGYGVTVADSKAPVTPKTLFQAGSISKPVAATAALYMVEQGKLALDENVSDKLKTWKVPENEFTQTEKVTLRRLMSHTGSLTVHGFPGYDVDAPLPTLVQILNGEKPANTAPVRVDFVPGTKFRYSGGGVTIEQLLMMDVSGKPFPALLRETVLDKIGMADSSYEQPLPPNPCLCHGRRNLSRWQGGAREMAHLSGDGRCGPVDYPYRPRPLCHRDRPLEKWEVEPCLVAENDQRNAHSCSGRGGARLLPRQAESRAVWP